jgi:hypothetical protein
MASKLEYLDHVPGCEGMHHGPICRLNLRGRLAHLHPRDPLDVLPERVRGVRKDLAVELLHLGGTGGASSQGLLGRRQASCRVITRVSSLRTTVTDRRTRRRCSNAMAA